MDEFNFEVGAFDCDERRNFTIDNDSLADWAVKKIKETEAECDRLTKLCDAHIKFYEDEKKKLANDCIADTTFLRLKLQDYFTTVKPTELKSMYKYKLIAGTLVQNKPKVVYKRDDAALAAFLKQSGRTEYIKVIPASEEIAWGDLKKQIEADAENGVATIQGELVDGITVESVPGDFIIK